MKLKMISGLIFVLVLSLYESMCASQEDYLTTTIGNLEQLAEDVKRELVQVRNEVGKTLRNLKRIEFDWLRSYFILKRPIPLKIDQLLKKSRNEVEDMIKTLKKQTRDLRFDVHEFIVLHRSGDKDKKESSRNGSLSKARNISIRSTVPLDSRIGNYGTIIFTKVLENDGDAYDNHTGVFVAPITGTYYFSLQVCLGEHYGGISIRSDRNIYSWARFHPSFKSCQSANILTPLQRGDQVYSTKGTSWGYNIKQDIQYDIFLGVLVA